jgi:hypothetical protein
MARSRPETVICHYRVIPGRERKFQQLLRRHWPTLRQLALVTNEPPLIFRGLEDKSLLVEIFTWRDAAAFRIAHQHPAVQAIWEPMGALTRPRDGRPAMEFPHFQRVRLPLAAPNRR